MTYHTAIDPHDDRSSDVSTEPSASLSSSVNPAPDSSKAPSKDREIDPYVKAALGKKALGLVVLDVGRLTSIADFFIVCSGRSNRQVTAIAEHIQITLKEQNIRPLSVEGIQNGHWVLMDYGHVIIHVFYDAIRNFYDLEGLWADARRIKIPDMKSDGAAPEEREVSNGK